MKLTFSPYDLNQISQESLEKLNKAELIQLALRLRNWGIDMYELLKKDSTNSSKPPSSDSPYKGKSKDKGCDVASDDAPDKDTGEKLETPGDRRDRSVTDAKPKRQPGRQPGAQGVWRNEKPVADEITNHHPEHCALCSRELPKTFTSHSGFYTFELESDKDKKSLRIKCILHRYFVAVCDCGHENVARPGEGYVSELAGRKRNVKLSEYTMVGPMLAAFIAALSRRCGMSRNKIREFLISWFNFEISTGLICKTIREAGIACYPVVEELIEDLQKADQVHMDETPWYQRGVFCWIWVILSKRTAVYHVGTRKKEELLNLITEAFVGWLITDGYGAYRSYSKRQRCLAHLIRKAVALTGAVDEDAQKTGDWFLRELRGLIKAMAQGEDGKKECRPILARLKRACNLGSKSEHAKLKSLAKEILNDWDAVVAFVKNPGLPPTNNDAERALRWVVLYRKITYGSRTTEGSRSYAALISAIETCRLRGIDPWPYIASTIALGRKGIAPHAID
jgi:transposase